VASVVDSSIFGIPVFFGALLTNTLILCAAQMEDLRDSILTMEAVSIASTTM
jgi:hypothetical protein